MDWAEIYQASAPALQADQFEAAMGVGFVALLMAGGLGMQAYYARKKEQPVLPKKWIPVLMVAALALAVFGLPFVQSLQDPIAVHGKVLKIWQSNNHDQPMVTIYVEGVHAYSASGKGEKFLRASEERNYAIQSGLEEILKPDETTVLLCQPQGKCFGKLSQGNVQIP